MKGEMVVITSLDFYNSSDFTLNKLYTINNALVGFGNNHYGIYNDVGVLVCVKEDCVKVIYNPAEYLEAQLSCCQKENKGLVDRINALERRKKIALCLMEGWCEQPSNYDIRKLILYISKVLEGKYG